MHVQVALSPPYCQEPAITERARIIHAADCKCCRFRASLSHSSASATSRNRFSAVGCCHVISQTSSTAFCAAASTLAGSNTYSILARPRAAFPVMWLCTKFLCVASENEASKGACESLCRSAALGCVKSGTCGVCVCGCHQLNSAMDVSRSSPRKPLLGHLAAMTPSPTSILPRFSTGPPPSRLLSSLPTGGGPPPPCRHPPRPGQVLRPSSPAWEAQASRESWSPRQSPPRPYLPPCGASSLPPSRPWCAAWRACCHVRHP